MATKKRNHRDAKKRSLRMKHGITDCSPTHDSMSASKRGWGQGKGKGSGNVSSTKY